MKNPKVGERVRRYMVGSIPYEGEIIRIADTDILIRTSCSGEVWAHPKQCRRLVKRKRREWWINIDADKSQIAYDGPEEAIENRFSDWVECVHVVEVKEKK